MGNEFATTSEWNYKTELPWHLLQYHYHSGMQECIKALCHLLKTQPALHENQFNQYGFEWIDLQHRDESVICFMRKGKKEKDNLLIVMNMTPVVRHDWMIRVWGKKKWKELFNSDATIFGGSGEVKNEEIKTVRTNDADTMITISIHIPPLALLILR